MNRFKKKTLFTHWINLVAILFIILFESLQNFNNIDSKHIVNRFYQGISLVFSSGIIVVFISLIIAILIDFFIMKPEKKVIHRLLLIENFVFCIPFIYWFIKYDEIRVINFIFILTINLAYFFRRKKIFSFLLI